MILDIPCFYILELNYLDVNEKEEYEKIVRKVLEKCFEEEELNGKNLYVNVVITTPQNIRTINKEHRGIDKETDVLSFPMFEKDEIKTLNPENEDVLGDMVISLNQVEKQAEEYGHSFERELSYMLVHGFYHLMGYDHIEEEDKKKIQNSLLSEAKEEGISQVAKNLLSMNMPLGDISKATGLSIENLNELKKEL